MKRYSGRLNLDSKFSCFTIGVNASYLSLIHISLNGMLNEFIIELEKKELSLWRQGKTITLSLIKEEFKSNTEDVYKRQP